MKKKQKKVASKAKVVAKKIAPKKVIAALPMRSFGDAGIMPLGDRVLVQPLSREEMGTTTNFGLIIPDTVGKEKPEQGTVVAVGPGKRGDDGSVTAIGVAVGDKVLFAKYGYEEVKVGGTEYYIIAETNILAVVA